MLVFMPIFFREFHFGACFCNNFTKLTKTDQSDPNFMYYPQSELPNTRSPKSKFLANPRSAVFFKSANLLNVSQKICNLGSFQDQICQSTNLFTPLCCESGVLPKNKTQRYQGTNSDNSIQSLTC